MAHIVQFEWELPESLLSVVAADPRAIGEELKQAAVLDWVRMRRISCRKGAELLGMAYRDFLSLMCQHKVPAIDDLEGRLEGELAAFENATKKNSSP